MALFQYKSINSSGENQQGEMEAGSKEEVIFKLQQAGEIPVTVEEGASGFSLSQFSLQNTKPKSREILQFTQQLSNLLNAGLPLDRSLQILEELAESVAMEKLVHDIREQVREGSTLAEALESKHGVFSRLFINMVRAGEISGALESTLARLAEYMERANALKESVVSALIYPALLLLMAGGSLFLLLVFVVPQFTPMFEEMGGELPGITKMVIFVAEILKNDWWIIALMGMGVTVYMKGQMGQAESRLKWDTLFLKMPLVGGLIQRIEMARLSRTLSTLLSNGVALLTSLSIAQKVLGNTVMSQDVTLAADAVKKGGMLSLNLAKNDHFPRLALQMIQVGEETGRMESMLSKVADTYDEEVRLAVDRMLALLVPVLVILLAMLIGTIVLAIIMAILSVNDIVV